MPPISNKCKQLFNSCKILFSNQRSQLQISIIKANKVLQHSYRPPPKGTFNNEEVDKLVKEPYKRVPLKKAAKVQLATAIATKAAAQVEDDVTNEEENNKQYAAIKIDYENEVIGEV